MSARILVFGCSLSASGAEKCWAQQVTDQTNIPNINLAVPASSNQLQIRRFQSYILNNTIDSNDIVIWEITGAKRPHKRVKPGIMFRKRSTFTSHKNLFDNKSRVDYLAYHSDLEGVKVDEEQVLEDLLFHLLVVKKFTPKLLVVFGWEKVISKKHLKKFKEYLTNHNIDFIDEPILEHSVKNKLPLHDTWHPLEIGYVSYANNCVLPRLKELKWIN